MLQPPGTILLCRPVRNRSGLYTSSAVHVPSRSGWVGYWVFRHPRQGVVARAFGRFAGSSIKGGDYYGVFTFIPDDAGKPMSNRPDGSASGTPSLAGGADRRAEVAK